MIPRIARFAIPAVLGALVPALFATVFHVVPTTSGLWHGVSDAPSFRRSVVALLLGAVCAAAVARLAPRARAPLWGLALAATPFVPALLGTGVFLLAFQGSTLVAMAAIVASLVLVRGPGRSLAEPPSWVLFAVSAAFFIALGTRLPGPAGPQGDEPHYLLMAESLLRDGDVDLANQFAARAYAPFYAGELLAHTSPRSPRGRILPVHTPGLPALLLPGYAAAGYAGARVELALFAALTAALTHRLVKDVTRSAPLALLAWAALSFTPPFALYALSIYPEAPAAPATAVFLLASRNDPGPWSIAAATLAAAVLPWIHPKFLPLAGLGLFFTLARRCSWTARSLAVGTMLASIAGLFAFFHATYGVATPTAAYGSGFSGDVTLANVPRGLTGFLVDRQFGLAVNAPFWLLAIPGAASLVRDRLGDALRAGLLALVTLVVGASFSMWWGGACPPGRFIVPALPALALFAAQAAARRRETAAICFGWSATVLGLAAWAPRALHNRGDGESALLRFLVPVLDLDGRLPSMVSSDASSVLLAATLLAALALAWSRGRRGLLLGSVAYVLVATGQARTPLLDARQATTRLLYTLGGSRPPVDAPPLNQLRVDLDLPEAPWTLGAGDVFNSRRFELPAGTYTVEVSAVPLEGDTGLHLARLELLAGDDVLAQSHVRVGSPARFDVTVPVGARRLAFSAVGAQGRVRIDGVRLMPERLKAVTALSRYGSSS